MLTRGGALLNKAGFGEVGGEGYLGLVLFWSLSLSEQLFLFYANWVQCLIRTLEWLAFGRHVPINIQNLRGRWIAVKEQVIVTFNHFWWAGHVLQQKYTFSASHRKLGYQVIRVANEQKRRLSCPINVSHLITTRFWNLLITCSI